MTDLSPVVQQVERTLAQDCGRAHCIYFSRGASALFCLFRHIVRERPGAVVMPSLLCMSPAFAATYAGARVLYADAREDDFQVSANHVASLIEANPEVRAVLVPHLFGSRADIEAITAITCDRQVVVIEDAAQSQGMTIDGVVAGSFGDVSLLSFGHTKILDVGGGAALLFDRDDYEEPLRKLASGMAPRSPCFESLAAAYRVEYYALAPMFRAHPEAWGLYSSFPDKYRDLYLYADLDEAALAGLQSSLPHLDEQVAHRRAIGRIYREGLRHRCIRHPEFREGDVPWRYSFLVDVPDPAQLADAVRSHGVNVSNWYPPLHRMLSGKQQVLPTAEYVGSHIFNLWTDSSVDATTAQQNIRVFMTEVDRHAG